MSSNKELKIKVGKRIERIRKEMNLNKETFAKKLGISGQYLGIVEKGESSLSYEKLKKLCEVSGYSSDYILFGITNKSNKQSNCVLDNFSEEQVEDICKIIELMIKFVKDYEL